MGRGAVDETGVATAGEIESKGIDPASVLLQAVEPDGRFTEDRHRLFLRGAPKKSGAATATRPGLVAAPLSPWPEACGSSPDLPFLAFTLHDGGQPMEVVLSGVEAGRRLIDAGFNMLIGPPLLPQSWRSGPELAARASAAFVEGLSAAGVVVCADAFPDVGPEALTGVLGPFANAFAHGVEAVRLALDAEDRPGAARRACHLLRRELGFRGVIVADTRESDAPALVDAGCDLLVTHDLNVTLEHLQAALESGKPARGRMLEAQTRIEALIEAWL